jgi:hypothetical protein
MDSNILLAFVLGAVQENGLDLDRKIRASAISDDRDSYSASPVDRKDVQGYQSAAGDHSSAKVSIWRRTSSVAVGWASGG